MLPQWLSLAVLLLQGFEAFSADFQVSVSAMNTTEGDCVDIYFTLTGTRPSATSIVYDIVDGTAKGGEDFDIVQDKIYEMGDSSMEAVCFETTDDNIVEGEESFNVVVKSVAPIAPEDQHLFGEIDQGTFTSYIKDNDVNINLVKIRDGREGGDDGSALFNLTLTDEKGNPRPFSGPGSLQVNIINNNQGTATRVLDFTPNSFVFIPEGETEAEAEIQIIDDTSVEQEETIVLQISSGAVGVRYTNDPVTFTITDNDFELAVEKIRDGEEGGDNAQVKVVRTGATTEVAEFSYSTTDLNTNSPGDYTPFTSEMGQIPIGESFVIIEVEIQDDSILEPDETFSFELTSATAPGYLGANTDTTVKILDNEYEVSIAKIQDGIEGGQDAKFQVTRAGSISSSATVMYSTSDGTATSGSDFTAVSSGTIDFAANETTQDITITVTNDADIEGDEVFDVNLHNLTVSGSGVLGSQSSASATIVDNDVGFAISKITDGEKGRKDPEFEVVRRGSFTEEVTVPFSIVDGIKATASHTLTLGDNGLVSEDYDWRVRTSDGSAEVDLRGFAGGTLTFPANDMEPRTIEVALYDDGAMEGDKTFSVELGTPSIDSATILLGMGTATATIFDDDFVLNLMKVQDGAEDNENSVPAEFKVTRTGATYLSVNVMFSLVGGSAESDVDFRPPLEFSVTVASGSSESAVVDIPIVDDSDVDPDETFNVTITSQDGPVGVDTVSFTIGDNDFTGGGISDKNTCVDSNRKVVFFFERPNQKTRDCHWLSERSKGVQEWYCRNAKREDGLSVSRICRQTCGRCGRKKSCVDRKSEFYSYKKRRLTCDYLDGTKKDRIRRAVHCLPGSQPAKRCKKSCNCNY